MSILRPEGHRQLPSHRASRRPATDANDTVLRATGVLTLIAIGAIHFLQIVPTTEASPLLGISFLMLIAACLIVAARLATGSDHRTWMASATVCGAAIGGYAFTRTFNTLLDSQDAGNWSCMLGMAALFVEVSLLAVSAVSLRTLRARQPALRPARSRARVAPSVPGTSSAA